MQRLTRITVILLFAALGVSLTGCGTLQKTAGYFGLGGSNQPETAETIAMRALDHFNHGKYAKAYREFESLKDRYPFSEYSLLAELKMADSKYFDGEYLEAVTLYEDFESNHPTNEAIPYIMFQIGMSHWRQLNTVDRDPGGAYDAILAFSRLLRTFPVSPYTEEAKIKIATAKNFLANHELYIANFYIRTNELGQAEGRLQYILDTYPESPVADTAKELLAAVRSDNPPKRTWRDWLPELSLPDWKAFSMGYSPSTGGQ